MRWGSGEGVGGHVAEYYWWIIRFIGPASWTPFGEIGPVDEIIKRKIIRQIIFVFTRFVNGFCAYQTMIFLFLSLNFVI